MVRRQSCCFCVLSDGCANLCHYIVYSPVLILMDTVQVEFVNRFESWVSNGNVMSAKVGALRRHSVSNGVDVGVKDMAHFVEVMRHLSITHYLTVRALCAKGQRL